MDYRRRRNKSEAGQLISDTAYIANRLSWKGALVFGVVVFSIFYWMLPAWITSQANNLDGNMYKPMFDAIFAKRIHWLKWIGISLGLISLFFSAYKYIKNQSSNRIIEKRVGFFSRLLARIID